MWSLKCDFLKSGGKTLEKHKKVTESGGKTSAFGQDFGRSGEAQTRGLRIPNAARYQLRYTPIVIQLWSCRWSNLWSGTVLTVIFCFPNRPKSALLKGFRRLSLSYSANTVYAPKAGALPTALHPDFLFCFFRKTFRASLLCPPSCKMSPMPRLKARPALCFAALPQAPCICHRQRSPSSPKAGALPTALHPDFLFCFFRKIFRASPALSARHTASTSRSRHLCYFNISGRVCQAGDWAGNCGCSIRTYAYAKKNTTALAHAGAVVFFGG